VLETDAAQGDMSEAEYAETFGVTPEQMNWRRAETANMRSADLFRSEYPATPEESFVYFLLGMSPFYTAPPRPSRPQA